MTGMPQWVKDKRDEGSIECRGFDYNSTGDCRRRGYLKGFEDAWELFTETVRPTVEFYGGSMTGPDHNGNRYYKNLGSDYGEKARELKAKLWGDK